MSYPVGFGMLYVLSGEAKYAALSRQCLEKIFGGNYSERVEIMDAKSKAVLSVLAILFVGYVQAEDLPLGHANFHPSINHPIGWRGDNSGIYPGATPVTSFDIEKGKNVRWKLRMPETGNAQPVIIGDLVITTTEQFQLIAVDLKTGSIRWQTTVNPMEYVPNTSKDEQEKFLLIAPLFDEMRTVQYEYKLASSRRPPSIELPRKGWKIMRDVLARLDAVKFPGLSIRIPTEVEIDQETIDTIEKSALNKCFKDPFDWFEKKYNFPLAEVWPEVGGFTLATPVSDGTHVYISFGQGQLGAYDVTTGRKVWGHFIKPQRRCNAYTAPLIVDGLLIIQRDGALRAYTPATGKLVWETPHIGAGNGYCMGVPHVLRPDGKTALLVTATGQVYRLADGKLLGDLGVRNKGSEWGGVSTVGDGKDMVFMLPGGNHEDDMIAYRIAVKGDSMEKTEVWKNRQANRSITPVYYQGLIYHNQDDKKVVVRDATTGTVMSTLACNTRFASPAIAGQHLFILFSNGLTVTSLGKDIKLVSQSKLVEDCNHPDCKEKSAGKSFSCKNVTCEVAPCFSGDAMVIRTHNFLYCFSSK